MTVLMYCCTVCRSGIFKTVWIYRCIIRTVCLALMYKEGCNWFSRLTGQEPLAFLSSPYSGESAGGKAHMKQCEQMTLTRRQKRACRREPGMAETLRESVRLSLMECRYQFRNERWNCSMDGRGSLLKRGRALRGGSYWKLNYNEGRWAWSSWPIITL